MRPQVGGYRRPAANGHEASESPPHGPSRPGAPRSSPRSGGPADRRRPEPLCVREPPHARAAREPMRTPQGYPTRQPPSGLRQAAPGAGCLRVPPPGEQRRQMRPKTSNALQALLEKSIDGAALGAGDPFPEPCHVQPFRRAANEPLALERREPRLRHVIRGDRLEPRDRPITIENDERLSRNHSTEVRAESVSQLRDGGALHMAIIDISGRTPSPDGDH